MKDALYLIGMSFFIGLMSLGFSVFLLSINVHGEEGPIDIGSALSETLQRWCPQAVCDTK